MSSHATALVPAVFDASDGEILDLLPGPVLLSIDGAMIYANPAALEVFGVDDLAALRVREATRAHVFPEDIPRIERRLAAVARGEQVARSVEYRIVRPDDSVRVVLWTTLRTTLGNRPAMLYAIDDITELAEARDAVAASEAHQREIVAALAEGVIVVDRDGTCTEANPAAAELLRMPVNMLVGAPVDALPLIDAKGVALERSAHPVWRALDERHQTRGDVVRVRFGQQVRKMRISALPIEAGAGGAPIGVVVTFDDVTGELERNDQIARNEERFRNLAAISPVAIFETDSTGSCSYVNDRWCEFTGLPAQRAMGAGWRDALHPDDVGRFLAAWSASMASGNRLAIEFRYRRPDGSEVPVHAEAVAIVEASGRIAGWIGTATDLSAEIELRHELRENEARFRQLAEHSPDVVVRINLDPFRFDYLSPAITNLTGTTPTDLYADATLIRRHIHPDDIEQLALTSFDQREAEREFRVVHLDGTVRTVELRGHTVSEHGQRVAIEATVRDVTTKAAQHQLLDQLAHRDAVTGLLNRRALMTALDRRLLARHDTALLFLDLDDFKAVNDTFGHDAGDEILRAFAQRLTNAVRDNDIVARFAGDEFVVVATVHDANSIARRLLDELAAPIALNGGGRATVGVSIGMASLDPADHWHTAESLLQQADRAMYEAKRRGKGQLVTLADAADAAAADEGDRPSRLNFS